MTFLSLIPQVFSALMYGWPITLLLFLVASAGLANALYRAQLKGRGRDIWLLAGQLIFPLAILIAGTVLAAPIQIDPELHTYSTAPIKYAPVVVDALTWLHPAYFVWLIYKLKGIRILTITMSLLIFWMTIVCTFIASMSVTGVWL